MPSTPTTSQRSVAPSWAIAITATTLTTGVLVHAIALFRGRDWLLTNVLTPAVDIALIVPMGLSAWMLWHLRHRAVLPRAVDRRIYTFLSIYMAISALVHVETLLVGEVRYVARFPHWYSAFILPVQAGLLTFTARLRFSGPAPRQADRAR